ncbi:leucine-rich repeat domain-containing protein [Chryseobacterium sp. D764]|jgi:hypothetical protein|uniref:leucine-rich repeat domain-containing protein n=1 Tax=unclassified Chryseobacterium TaxID=2593645 RepID=UPI0015C1FFF1|nr:MULTISPECIES: leucine-rich repeat domain-containing protein [unclassified Chryseobacterium]QXU48236.1 leucine-rich repeat domain-containing protein [Chryseobacterium sp. D764]CAD0222812.1 conserved protein of unknown function [Chryseobacterium sp. JV274]
MKTKEELKLYFENGDIPKQEDFWEWQDAYWHKSERLNNSSLDLIIYDDFSYSPTDNTEITGTESTIVFPEGVKIIGGFSFSMPIKRISKIVFPKSLERIRTRAFNAQYLKGTLTIPGSCKIVESYAFASGVASVSKLVLENGIETIEDGAFQLSGSPITFLDIPNSVKFVGKNAFAISSLQTVAKPVGLDITEAGIPATATILDRFTE